MKTSQPKEEIRMSTQPDFKKRQYVRRTDLEFRKDQIPSLEDKNIDSLMHMEGPGPRI